MEWVVELRDTAFVRVLVVDDQPDVRALTGIILGLAPGTSVAGEAASGEDALAGTLRLRPDVVLLDQTMPGLDGLATARLILARRPDQAIVLMSAEVDDDLRREAVRVGARGCVAKGDLQQLPAAACAAVAVPVRI